MARLHPDPRNHPPTAQTGGTSPGSGIKHEDPDDDWLTLAETSFNESTSFTDANYRKAWEDSIRMFNNQHPSDSKYNQPSYEKRSKLFRPKIRSVIRKNEAAAAAAFFSNIDVVTVNPQDQNSKVEAASAAVMKELLQYRLTKTIPWYMIVLGGLQDAQTVGVVCAHVYWKYEEEEPDDDDMEEGFQAALEAAAQVIARRESAAGSQAPDDDLPAGETSPGEADLEYPDQGAGDLPPGAMVTDGNQLTDADENGEPIEVEVELPPKITADHPVVDLIPVENIRISPSANWIDPVNSSPYFIHLIPMHVGEVKEKMEKGEWIKLGDDVMSQATELRTDSTRTSRTPNRDDPLSQDNTSIDDYAIVWVQRHIHRKNGKDWEFYTLGTAALLTEPELLKKNVLHGIRPYVIGCCILETHKIFPAGLPQLGRGLQDETNEVTNQRLDNVKFVLNKKWFVKRGKEADIAGLVRNVPGGVVLLDDPEKDVREVTWQDVTSSSFEEHRGISMEMDDLLGNFNPAQLMMAKSNNPARNMSMLSNAQGTMVEYLIRTYVETFVTPLLRQLVKLEQAYETDQVVLKIAAKKAEVFQKFGTDQITDNLLEQELTLTVNVGMGATDPMMRLQKFLLGMERYTGMLQKPVPGINMQEVGKEVFGLLGYADGTRFFNNDNPQVAMLQQQMKQMMVKMNELAMKVKDKEMGHQVKLQTTRETGVVALRKQAMHEEAENKRSLATHWRALTELDRGHAHERHMAHVHRLDELATRDSDKKEAA